MTTPIKLGLLGSSGRMGEWVKQLISTEFSDQTVLCVSADKGDALESLLDTDVIIDFSLPPAMIEFAKLAQKSNAHIPALVIASTGWTDEQKAVVTSLKEKTPILFASNFSTGVLATQKILNEATKTLTALGYKPVLTETHHQHKKDAPSGTAVSLQKIISPQNPTKVQTHSIREGEVVGDHQITFFGPGDQITLSHHAQDRSIFARGAIEAAIWLNQKKKQSQLTGVINIEDFFNEVTNSK